MRRLSCITPRAVTKRSLQINAAQGGRPGVWAKMMWLGFLRVPRFACSPQGGKQARDLWRVFEVSFRDIERPSVCNQCPSARGPNGQPIGLGNGEEGSAGTISACDLG